MSTLKRLPVRAFLVAVAVAVPLVLTSGPSTAADGLTKVDAEALTDADARGTTTVIVNLRDQADLSAAESITDRAARKTYVYQTLTAFADRKQAGLRGMLRASGTEFTAFWAANAIIVHGADRGLITRIAARSDVATIDANRAFEVPRLTPEARAAGILAIEWGINMVKAPNVWSKYSKRGEGIVVANVDTGVDFDHPAVVRQYRGNTGTGFNHNYNWRDPSGVCGTTPCDNNNHGTHTMGTMVGEDASGTNQIGVAPAAKWIAAKGCESNSCSPSNLMASMQWMLAPTDSANQNPRPDLAPDVVNNSWGGGRGSTTYQTIINNWRSAGIFPAFANGNSGAGGCNTANSPGDNPSAYGVGAVDINGNLASFSSRGYGGFNNNIKPDIAAPGANVRSAINGGGYSNFSGTSMATPHLAGVVALIWSVAPSFTGNINETIAALDGTAVDKNNTSCGGTAANNNFYGEGIVDALAAADRLSGGGPNPPVVVFEDNFETERGWTRNPNGTDNATTGLWERGDPEQTASGASVMQLGTTTSGTNDLVTARLAGASVGANDIDVGTTSIRGPAISLPAAGTLTLTFSWYLSHLSNSSSADFIRVSIVTSSGTTQVFQQLGAASVRAGAWATATVNLSSFAGQSVQILVAAADASTASLVEAGVDDVRITQQT